MPEIRNREFQIIFSKAVNKYRTDNNISAEDWKYKPEQLEGLSKRLVGLVKSKKIKLSGTTLLNNYYYKTKKNGEAIFDECNYEIVDLISKYATDEEYFQPNRKILDQPGKPVNFKVKEHSINVDFAAILKYVFTEEAERSIFFGLIDFKNVWLHDEGCLPPNNYYQDREAADMFAIYIREMAMGGYTDLPPLSITRECSIPFSLQKLLKSHDHDLKLRVLCLKQDENIEALRDVGCIVYAFTREELHLGPDEGLDSLSKEAVLFRTNNMNGIYARDEKYFAEKKLIKKHELYDEIIEKEPKYIFVPYKKGIIYKDLMQRKKDITIYGSLLEKHESKIDNNNANNIQIVEKTFLDLAKRIYDYLEIKFDDLSASPLGLFLQQFKYSTASFKKDDKCIILNIGKAIAKTESTVPA